MTFTTHPRMKDYSFASKTTNANLPRCSEENLPWMTGYKPRHLVNRLDLSESCSWRRRIEEGLAYIELHCPELHDVFCLAIQTMFFFDSPTMSGGTNSEAVGVIWVNIKLHWSVHDVAEFLIHELTHNLIFIDELVDRHFNYALLPREENFALSAILGVRRPLDKVFHSILVAYEILSARRQFLGDASIHVHPPSAKLHQGVSESLESLHSLGNLDELLTERGRSLIRDVSTKLDEFPLRG